LIGDKSSAPSRRQLVQQSIEKPVIFAHRDRPPPQLGSTAAYAKQAMRDKLIEHKAYIQGRGEGEDWRWPAAE